MKCIKEVILAILLGAVLPGFLLCTVDVQGDRAAEAIKIPVLKEQTVVMMDLDAYLTGVLLAEMPPYFHMEAIKAQAVAARTYTLHKYIYGSKHQGAAVCTSSTCCQGYISPEAYLTNGGSDETVFKMQEAVSETKQMALYYNDKLIEATYFASAGDKTESAMEVWGVSLPYLLSVMSNEDDTSYDIKLSCNDFCTKLNVPVGYVSIEQISYTQGGGIADVTINGIHFSGAQLRKLLALRSTDIMFDVRQDEILITTNGYGHRVGMSQNGANVMAEQGSSYRQILKHYYTGISIKEYTDVKN